jgi:multimeric flavodoxin WrbA
MKYSILIILAALPLLFSACSGDGTQNGGNVYKKTEKSANIRKKTVIISSSPRKGGNSDLLCDQFMKGAQEAGHEVEKIFLNDKDIHFFVRDDYRSKDSIVYDDAPAVVQKMVSADVIVLATPVYFYTMCGQMKTLIDRTYDRHTELKNKEFYYIITAAIRDKSKMVRTIEEFRGFLDCLPDASECGIVLGMGTWNKGDVNDTPAMLDAYEMGKNI